MSASMNSKPRRPSIASNGPSERTALLGNMSDVSGYLKADDEQDIDDEVPVGSKAEFKALARMTIPLWITFVLEYAIGGLSIMFVGHLGVKSLNAASIGNLTMSTTTVAPLIYGLCAALDTLATQAYTSSNPKNTSLYVMRTAVIIYASLIPASILLWFGEDILLALKQDAEVAHLAGQYIRVYLAGIPLLAGYELIRRWLQVQGLILIPTLVLFIAAPLCLTLNYLLVLGPESISMGFIGSAVAVVITNAVMFVTLAIYVVFFTPRDAWGGLNSAIFHDLGPNIRLGLAGIAATCSEWLSWDIVSIMSSLIGPEPFAANQILIVFAVTTYQLPYAMSVAASIRIGNLVGAQQVQQAKLATQATRIATIAVGLLNSAVAIISRNHISRIFTEDRSVSQLVSLVMPLVALFQILDAISGTCSGILRGAGLAGIAARANIIAYWFFGIPTGMILAFHFKWGLQGLWTGHVVALSLTTMLTGIPTYTIRWHERAEAAQLQAEETEAYLQAHRIDHEE